LAGLTHSMLSIRSTPLSRSALARKEGEAPCESRWNAANSYTGIAGPASLRDGV